MGKASDSAIRIESCHRQLKTMYNLFAQNNFSGPDLELKTIRYYCAKLLRLMLYFIGIFYFNFFICANSSSDSHLCYCRPCLHRCSFGNTMSMSEETHLHLPNQLLTKSA
jgi:hypothetical protein